MHRSLPFPLLPLLFGLILCASPSAAEWSHSTSENNFVHDLGSNADYPVAFPDGSGGMVLAWIELIGIDNFVVAQRIDADGNLLWDPAGVVATQSDLARAEGLFAGAGDGAGGIFVGFLYDDGVTARAGGQYIDPEGNLPWGPDGLLLAPGTTGVGDELPSVAPDGAGGAAFFWSQYPSGDTAATDVIGQRVDAAGTLLWGTAGASVCDHPAGQDYVAATAAGAGLYIVAWSDTRNEVTNGRDVYAQRVHPGGGTAWQADGMLVSNVSEDQNVFGLVVDGAGAGIVVFEDRRDFVTNDTDIWAARILGENGLVTWQSPVTQATGRQSPRTAVADGYGGFVLIWEDSRAGTAPYAQRLDAAGVARWEPDGLALFGAGVGYPRGTTAASDGAGSYYFTSGVALEGSDDHYAQKVDRLGVKLWSDDGRAVCRQSGSQAGSAVIADGRDGIIAVWQDRRNGFDLYAQRLDAYGKLGDAAPRLDAAEDQPQDQGGVVLLGWGASYLDGPPWNDIARYSVWRRFAGVDVPPLREIPPGERLAPDLAMREGGWSFVGEVPAYRLGRYGLEAPSYGDSTPSEIVRTDFLVLAHGSDETEFWASELLTAVSVDNLAPGVPLALVAQADGSDVDLRWEPSGDHDGDLSVYNLYRGDAPGFPVGAGSFLAAVDDTLFTDPDPGNGQWYYRVAAEDVHENEGPPSNEADAVILNSGTGSGAPVPALLGAFPNPFNPSTTIRFSLPVPGRARLDLFAPDGRRVATLLDAQRPAGANEVEWNGSVAGGRRAASGVYLARLTVGTWIDEIRLVLLK